MAKKDSSKKVKPKSTPQRVDINVVGNVEKSNIVVGSNNVVNNYYQVVEQNLIQHDPDYWNLKHPYPMPPNFTGRLEERAMLTHWLDGDAENRLFILRALGGFGKSALAWQWLTHDVNPETWKKVVFWSFYEGDSSFEHFVEETLKYLNFEIPPSKRNQVDALLRAMQADNILLIIDGFERALRAYSSMNAAYQGDEDEDSPSPTSGRGDRGEGLDCVDVNAEWFLKSVCALPNMKSKVLMTTRLTPRAILVGARVGASSLQGCREVELTAMGKADAVDFFHKQGIQGNRGEIESACELYGYHPLSLRLLAGRILKDFENPSDIVVAQSLKIDGDMIQQKHHVLEVSYNSMPEHEQKLLSTIACFRSPVKMETLEEINVGTQYTVSLQDDLHDLIDRGLLHFDEKSKKFDLHPIMRRFAYDHLTTADRTGTHERLVNYFEAVPKPEKVEKLEDLAPLIELYHHMVGAGDLDKACDLFYDRIVQQVYFQFGAYQLCIELMRTLFLDGEDKPPHLKKEDDQAWSLAFFANAYGQTGQPRCAIPVFQNAVLLAEKTGNKKNVSIGLGNMAIQQLVIGALKEAERNQRYQINLSVETDNKLLESNGHHELSLVLAICGNWKKSKQEQDIAQQIFEKENDVQGQGMVWSYRALRFLLLGRQDTDDKPSSIVHRPWSAIESAQRALEFAHETTKTKHPIPRDYVRAYWLLGATYRSSASLRFTPQKDSGTSQKETNDELTLADENLSKALDLCRQINLVEMEADILLDVARLRYAQGDFKDAQEKIEEALIITERSGYVLQGADVNLFLAELAVAGYKLQVTSGMSDKEAARFHAEEALKLATCDGPPYYYKVAYEEAEAMLEKLK